MKSTKKYAIRNRREKRIIGGVGRWATKTGGPDGHGIGEVSVKN